VVEFFRQYYGPAIAHRVAMRLAREALRGAGPRGRHTIAEDQLTVVSAEYPEVIAAQRKCGGRSGLRSWQTVGKGCYVTERFRFGCLKRCR
jgi:hypothetical protein